MTNSLLSPHIWLNICAYPHILGIGNPSSYMTSQLIPSEFLYMWEKIFFFFISAHWLTGEGKYPHEWQLKNVVPLTSFTGIRFWFYYGAKLNIFTKFSLMFMCSLLPKKITKILLRLKKKPCIICSCISSLFTTWVCAGFLLKNRPITFNFCG